MLLERESTNFIYKTTVRSFIKILTIKPNTYVTNSA